MYKIISYIIKPENPNYPDNSKTEFTSIYKIKNGDLCNTTKIQLYTHNDTHIDAPFHFNMNGTKISEIKSSDFFFNNIVVLDLNNKIGKEISLSDVGDSIKKDTDMLLIYSGISSLWGNSPDKFVMKKNQPWLSKNLAEYLIKNTNIRAIGVDFMCVDNLDNISNNKGPVHDILLGINELSKFIYIYENVNTKLIVDDKINKIYAFPMLLYGLDGSPVTMVAEVF